MIFEHFATSLLSLLYHQFIKWTPSSLSVCSVNDVWVCLLDRSNYKVLNFALMVSVLQLCTVCAKNNTSMEVYHLLKIF